MATSFPLSSHNTPRRVVVTGFGAITPLGLNVQSSWQALLEGKSGIDTILTFDTKDFPVHIAGEVKNFNSDLFVPKKEQKKLDIFIHYALAAVQEAMHRADLSAEKLKNSSLNPEKAGSIIGVGIGGLPRIEKQYSVYLEKGPSRFSTFIIPMVITNMIPGYLSLQYGLEGPTYAISSACASGAHAIGEATQYIRRGLCDLMIAGGAESVICPTALGGFSSMRALSRRNEEPQKASRPFDVQRDGFVLAEGAGILILEAYDRALKRKAPILGEILGYASSSDAYHITQPHPGGQGAFKAMKKALEDAHIKAEDLDYINAHGTSTPIGDKVESQAIEAILGKKTKDKTLVSSTKGATGHMLGAAGAVESLFCLLSLKDQKIPPNLNLEEPGEGCHLNYVGQKMKEAPLLLRYAMNNSFGFGGTNACLIFGSAPPSKG